MPGLIKTNDGLSIAWHLLDGGQPTVLFMPGFFSHMQGTKALWLEECCRNRGQAYVRFDYRGHGQSGGKFEESTLSDWLDDTLLVLDQIAPKPVVAVGSSMGGYIALLTAFARPDSVAGLVGIASSPDFTKTIYEDRMNEHQRNELHLKGFYSQPSSYREEPVIITKKLIDDGKTHFLLHRETLNLQIPVCLIHGKRDADVPWEKSRILQEKIGKKNCELVLVPDGEHRLSRSSDLRLIDSVVQKISRRARM